MDHFLCSRGFSAFLFQKKFSLQHLLEEIRLIDNKECKFSLLAVEQMERFQNLLFVLESSFQTPRNTSLKVSVFQELCCPNQVSENVKLLKQRLAVWGKCLGILSRQTITTCENLNNLFKSLFECIGSSIESLKQRKDFREPVPFDVKAMTGGFVPGFSVDFKPEMLFDWFLYPYVKSLFLASMIVADSPTFKIERLRSSNDFLNVQRSFLKYLRNFVLTFSLYQRPGEDFQFILAIFSVVSAYALRTLFSVLFTFSYWSEMKDDIIEICNLIISSFTKHREDYSRIFFEILEDPLTEIALFLKNTPGSSSSLLSFTKDIELFQRSANIFLDILLKDCPPKINGRVLTKLSLILDLFPRVSFQSISKEHLLKLPLAISSLLLHKSARFKLVVSNLPNFEKNEDKKLIWIQFLANQIKGSEFISNFLSLKDLLTSLSLSELRVLATSLIRLNKSASFKEESEDPFSIFVIKLALLDESKEKINFRQKLQRSLRTWLDSIEEIDNQVQIKRVELVFDILIEKIRESILKVGQVKSLISTFEESFIQLITLHSAKLRALHPKSQLKLVKYLHLWIQFNYFRKNPSSLIYLPKHVSCPSSYISDAVSKSHYCQSCYRLISKDAVEFPRELSRTPTFLSPLIKDGTRQKTDFIIQNLSVSTLVDIVLSPQKLSDLCYQYIEENIVESKASL